MIVNDNKLDATPTVADLDGDGKPEIVVRSQYSAITADSVQPGGISYLFAYHADGNKTSQLSEPGQPWRTSAPERTRSGARRARRASD